MRPSWLSSPPLVSGSWQRTNQRSNVGVRSSATRKLWRTFTFTTPRGFRIRTAREVRRQKDEWAETLADLTWEGDASDSLFPRRCRPICDHPLRAQEGEVGRWEGHAEARVQVQRRLLQEEAQEAHHCGGRSRHRDHSDGAAALRMWSVTGHWLALSNQSQSQTRGTSPALFFFLRCGTVTRWRMNSWVRWCWAACPRIQTSLRDCSCGSGDIRWPTRCPDRSAWGSSPPPSWPLSDAILDHQREPERRFWSRHSRSQMFTVFLAACQTDSHFLESCFLSNIFFIFKLISHIIHYVLWVKWSCEYYQALLSLLEGNHAKTLCRMTFTSSCMYLLYM